MRDERVQRARMRHRHSLQPVRPLRRRRRRQLEIVKSQKFSSLRRSAALHFGQIEEEERSGTTKEVGCRQLSTSIIITLACLNVMAALLALRSELSSPELRGSEKRDYSAAAAAAHNDRCRSRTNRGEIFWENYRIN